MIKVEKRDGSIVAFDSQKIFSAISKAFASLHMQKDDSIINLLVLRATADFQNKITNETISVEAIQDSVEKILSESGYYLVAKTYILYRKQRENVRKIQSTANEYKHLVNSYLANDTSTLDDENSMATFSVGGLILSNSGMITSNYWLSEVYDAQITKAHKEGDFYIHNINMLTAASAGWSLKTLILEGLPSVNGMIASRPAKHLSTLCNQIVNFLGIMQNEWASAQSLTHFDTLLVPYIYIDHLDEKAIYDCLDSFIYGMNIPSRWGTQAPFSQITMDWKIPESYKEKNAIIGGVEQNFTYGDCEKYMPVFHKVFFEIQKKGDIHQRGFQFPIVALYVDEDFDWMQEKGLFECTSKYGTPYFLTQQKTGVQGYFGYDENCGSIGTVTLNLPRIGYKSTSKEDFINKLDSLCDLAMRSLSVKRQVLNQLLEAGLFPYTKRYISNFDSYYGTIGIVGMNEACLNAKWLHKDLMDVHTQDLVVEILQHIKNKVENQKEKFNFEATPAESVCTHFCELDQQYYPQIISHGYYTNSTHLDVHSTDDVFEALRIQQKFQKLYTGSTSFPIYIDHEIENWQMMALFVQNIYKNFDMPVFTITPTFSICPIHGYLKGKHKLCPICHEKAQIWSRVSGYYRDLKDWNKGKQIEFSRRKTYSI